MNTEIDELPDLEGKVMVCYASTGFVSPDGDRGYLGSLRTPVFKRLAGRWFLVGKTTSSQSSWAYDQEAAIAWNDIGAYIAMDEQQFDLQREQRSKGKKRSRFGRR